MGVFEFLMLVCFGFSWPFAIMKSLKSRSTKGKSLMFMLLVELGYVFGYDDSVLAVVGAEADDACFVHEGESVSVACRPD